MRLIAGTGAFGLLQTLLNLAVYSAMILSCGILSFWNFPMFSMTTFQIPWFNWTFGQYLAALELMILLLSLAAALGTVFLSHISKSNIGILLQSLPLSVALTLLTSRLLQTPFFFTNLLSRRASGEHRLDEGGVESTNLPTARTPVFLLYDRHGTFLRHKRE